VTSVNHLFRSRLQGVVNVKQSLRPNQIIRGHIIKLYPNHKALVQLGDEKKIAQLEASLAVGKQYHFQVQENKAIIHLKVLGQPLTDETEIDISNLLKNLGIKVNRNNINFVQFLMKKNIPFDSYTFARATSLLDLSSNKGVAQYILSYMLSKQLPLSRLVFLSLYQKENHELSHLFNDIINDIKSVSQPTLREMQLLSHLETILGRKNLLLEHFNRNGQLLNLLFLKDQGSFKDDMQFQHALFQLKLHKQPLMVNAQTLLAKWQSTIKDHVENKKPLTPHIYRQFKQAFQKQIASFVSTSNRHMFMNAFSNEPSALADILNMLHVLSIEETFEPLNKSLFANHLAMQFLHKVHDMLTLTGLNDENMLAHDATTYSTSSIKQLLLHLLESKQSSLNQDRLQQLLHVLNGIQLQSVEETKHLLQAQLVIPGEPLLLNKDLFMQFQSKKTKANKIDPNFCRVIFYLHLNELKETIIDMHVQNRVIAITVFNDYPIEKSATTALESVLRGRLKRLDYQLTSITYKPLYEGKSNQQKQQYYQDQHFKGVDIRI